MEKTEICRESGAQYRYTLCLSASGSNKYEISVESERERASATVCGRLPEVVSLFESIVRGGVPGYILPEIIEDFKNGKF